MKLRIYNCNGHTIVEELSDNKDKKELFSLFLDKGDEAIIEIKDNKIVDVKTSKNESNEDYKEARESVVNDVLMATEKAVKAVNEEYKTDFKLKMISKMDVELDVYPGETFTFNGTTHGSSDVELENDKLGSVWVDLKDYEKTWRFK